MKIAITLLLLFACSSAGFSQSKKLQQFINDYEKFRYNLYQELDDPQMALQNGSKANLLIGNFLKENQKNIIAHRTFILDKNSREKLNDPASYSPIRPEDLDRINQSLTLINASKQTDALNPYLNLDLIRFASIDPVEFLSTVNAAVEQQVLTEHLHYSRQELATHYFRSMVGGKYISASDLGDNRWELQIDGYDYISTYHFHVETGKTTLKGIWIRISE